MKRPYKLVGPCLSLAFLAACGSSSTLQAFTPRVSGDASHASGSRIFKYTGGEQTFKVPSGVKQVTIRAQGGKGGRCCGDGQPGLGGSITATIPVTPGETLAVFVGGNGSAGTGGNAGTTAAATQLSAATASAETAATVWAAHLPAAAAPVVATVGLKPKAAPEGPEEWAKAAPR